MGQLLEESKKLAGLLLINKPIGITSFSLIPKLRYLFKEKKIGHGGTLDPLASGVMVYLIGRQYTKTANTFLLHDKEYNVTIRLGEERDTYDIDGNITNTSTTIPTLEAIVNILKDFNGTISQTPPMYSAKKVQGKKLYELARKGITIERKSTNVNVKTTLISYNYPQLSLNIKCSSGTYIRSIAHDIGLLLNCFGCVEILTRISSGKYSLENCYTVGQIEEASDLSTLLIN